LTARARGVDRVAAGFIRAPSKPSFRRLHNTKEKHMSKPTHIAYVVNEVTGKDGKKTSYL
jgi:hypothetical protein